MNAASSRRYLATVGASLLLVLVAGCASPQVAAPTAYITQPVFFATDRAPSGSSTPEKYFGPSRGASLLYGICMVSIPLTHEIGEMERPSWMRLEFSEDPDKHIVLHSVTVQSLGEFRTEFNSKLAGSTEKKALLFVHGYNVTFAEAARRTGQLAFDMQFRGPGSRGSALFYSWPSKGKLHPYVADENNADWTQTALTAFLVDFLQSTDIQALYVIAHSMGSRPTLRAIAALSRGHPELASRIREVVLAAPDIDADVFRTQIAPVFGPDKLSGTLYVSSEDAPLKASATLHGGYPRLGDPAAGPVITAGIETVDASEVDDGDFMGHTYFADRPALLSDIFGLVVNGDRATSRFGLIQVDTTAGRYWKFQPRAK